MKEPRTKEEIYDELKSSLTNKIAKLTNFTEQSFNRIWGRAFSDEIRKLEVRATVAELAGWIDYTGGPVSNEDLDLLDIDDSVTEEEIAEFMQDDYLDEFIKIVGVSRLPGSRATGEVTFTTQSAQTDIPSGTRVTTEPASDGTTLDFLTTEPAETSDGVTTVENVPIQADEVGSEHNLPSNTIIRVANPPVGVKGVDNPASTTGGTNEESNEDLRARAKSAVQSSSLGGTVDGIKGYIRQNVEGVGQGDIVLEEFTDQQPPFVDVIVDGGLDSEVSDAIEFSRPTAIRHDLVRPEIIQLGFNLSLRGQDIDTVQVNENIENFLLNFGLGDNFYEDEFIQIVMESDENIINIDDLQGFVERVTNETIKYQSGTTDYRLQFTYENDNGSIDIVDKDGNSYVKGTDYTVEDQTGDGWPETIVWSGGSTPNDGQDFFVDYDVTVPDKTIVSDWYATDLVRDEIFTFNLGETDTFEYNDSDITYRISSGPFDGTVTVEDQGGTTYTEDTDWQLAPLLDQADEDTFSYSTGTTDYELSNEITIDDVAIIDENGNIYIRGTDFTTIDTDSDGFDDTISWDDTQSTPGDGVSFTVNYNGYARTIRWDVNNSTPAQGDNFTVTYDQALYSTEYDIIETPGGIIRDESGDVYDEDVEYVLADCSCDGEKSAILWETNPTSLSDNEEFYFSYLTEGDIYFDEREKADPGTTEIGS